jgi:hypothetical protein
MQGNIAGDFLSWNHHHMEDSTIIAKTRIESFRDISFALIAGLSVCVSIGAMAGCVRSWSNAPADPVKAALAQCLEQPSLIIDTKDSDRTRSAKAVNLDGPALFKEKSDAVEKCRAMVFEFYKNSPAAAAPEKAN